MFPYKERVLYGLARSEWINCSLTVAFQVVTLKGILCSFQSL